mmetsp:Transcript_44172/g.116963  ORF Transcript_44172/g.116963 Transcript_44172/m.116963 type:complete len:204 (+) Transcript_44172:1699-2310(+)
MQRPFGKKLHRLQSPVPWNTEPTDGKTPASMPASNATMPGANSSHNSASDSVVLSSRMPAVFASSLKSLSSLIWYPSSSVISVTDLVARLTSFGSNRKRAASAAWPKPLDFNGFPVSSAKFTMFVSSPSTDRRRGASTPSGSLSQHSCGRHWACGAGAPRCPACPTCAKARGLSGDVEETNMGSRRGSDGELLLPVSSCHLSS